MLSVASMTLSIDLLLLSVAGRTRKLSCQRETARRAVSWCITLGTVAFDKACNSWIILKVTRSPPKWCYSVGKYFFIASYLFKVAKVSYFILVLLFSALSGWLQWNFPKIPRIIEREWKILMPSYGTRSVSSLLILALDITFLWQSWNY